MGKRSTVPEWIKRAKRAECAMCGRTDDLQYNHVVPVSQGGADVPENIIVLCADCHSVWHHGVKGKQAHGYMVKAGIAKARERNVRVGRKPADVERIMEIIAEHSTQFGGDWTEAEVREACGVGLTCYSKVKRQLLRDMTEKEWHHRFDRPVQMSEHPMYERVVKKRRQADVDSV